MKINKSFVLTAAATCLVGFVSPALVQADNIDSKIANEEQKIKDLSDKKASSDSSLADLESKINSLTVETDNLLNEKLGLEKEVNQLTKEISDLEKTIEKRNKKIEEQARSTQINQEKQDIVNVLLDSESFSDAIGRTVAYTKLVSANNDIMETQKEDQEALTKKKASVETKVEEVTQKAADLKVKQGELENSKAEQVKLANEILKNLDDAKNKKSEFVAQKEEAKRIAEEQAKRAKEVAAKEKAAQKAAAEAQKVAEEKLESEKPASLTKPMGDKGASDNSQTADEPSYASGFQRPLSSFTITSPFGGRQDPTGTAGDFHDGLDMAAPGGTPIMASRGGTVVESSFHPSAGNHVIIQHDNGYYTYYMHMREPGVASGKTVSAGEVIGMVGTTGNSTGDHLHFGVATGIWSGFMNPAPFIGL
ncbi:murein hydrolase activator EnvC family protein [Vagococcus sp.]|uniref:murein hydrolase activator EnvC family protein n=1 Tax=Vagococcus sp. TaxID=1933889 RepID=UPI002FCC5F4C